jgi:hypothetical protein
MLGNGIHPILIRWGALPRPAGEAVISFNEDDSGFNRNVETAGCPDR